MKSERILHNFKNQIVVKDIMNYSDLLKESKSKLRKHLSGLPIEQKIRILVELQKMGKLANPERTKDKMVWECKLKVMT